MNSRQLWGICNLRYVDNKKPNESSIERYNELLSGIEGIKLVV